MALSMTLELTSTPSNEIKDELEKILAEITNQDRELYSRQEVENMLLDIYSLLKNN